jgi:ABC-2 type transport system permease protein
MNLRRNVFLYFRFFIQQLKAIIEYETDFLITLLVAVLSQALGYIFLYVVYQRIPEINGWTFWEVTVVYALVYLSEGFVSFFFNGVWWIGGLVNRGGMDRLLLRPMSPIVQVLGTNVGMNGLGNLIFGFILIFQGLNHLDIEWSLKRIAGGILMLICAVMIRTAINLASNSVSFWMQSNRSSFPFLVHSLSDFARFPITIYSTVMQLLVSICVPYAFISFFPAAYLFDKEPWGLYAWLAPVVALYTMFGAYRLFQSGIKRYESTGN